MKLKLIVILLIFCISICGVSTDGVHAAGNNGEDFTYDSETKTFTILKDLPAWFFMGREEIQSQVQKAVVSEGVNWLNNGCFSGCQSLKSVTLPATLQSIQFYAFSNCDGLEEVIYNGTIEEWSQIEIKVNNDGLKNAVIHCTDGDTTYTPPEKQYDYTVADIVKAEFLNARDVIVGIDSYEMGIGANLTMKDGKTVYIDFGYEYDSDSSPYGGLYELNSLKWSLHGEENNVRFSTDSSNVSEDGEVVGTGTIPVTVSIPELDIEYNHEVEINAVENPVKGLAVMNSVTRKISKKEVEYSLDRTDILVSYSDSTQAALWEGTLSWSGWSYIQGSCSSFVYDHKLWDEETVDPALNIHGEKRHRVEYVLGKELDELKIGETYPLIIKYMGQEITTYITVTENETENFNYNSSGSGGGVSDHEPEPTGTAVPPANTREPQGTAAPGTPSQPGSSLLISSVQQPGSSLAQQTNISSNSGKGAVGKVSALKLKQKKRTVTALWKKVSGASGYQLCYSTSKKWRGKKQKLVIQNKAVIKNLKKEKTYYFRIRAYRLEGTKKVYGAWSGVKKIRIKK